LDPHFDQNSALACTAALCFTKIVLSPAREPGLAGLDWLARRKLFALLQETPVGIHLGFSFSSCSAAVRAQHMESQSHH